jgi:RNA polymerase sigma-70 factor (ECF subfamily)
VTSSQQQPLGPGLEVAAPRKLLSPDVGVDQTFESFYVREMPGLLLLARALAGSAEADDLAQESFLEAYRQWDRVRSFDSPVGWVRRVCANKAVSGWRRRNAELRALLRLGSQRPHPAPLTEDDEGFWTEVRRLPGRQAQVVALFYLYDLSIADVAQTLGCAQGTVKTHLSRGRSALALRLGESAQEDLS